TSADGFNWGQDTTLATTTSTDFMDKDMITVDQNPSSPHFGRVVVTWTDFGPSGQNFVNAFSDDGGASWTPAGDTINFPLNEGGTAFVVVWAAEDTLAHGRGLISLDAGASWSGPTGFSSFNVDFADQGDKFFPAAAFAADGRLNIGYSNRNVSATASNPNGTS